MQKTLIFLFGKEVAHRMQILDEALQAVERKHRAYFMSIQSKLTPAGQTSVATLTEFVQPYWIAGEATLDIDPALPPDITADCLECLRQVSTPATPPPARTRSFRAALRAFFTPTTAKPTPLGELAPRE